MLVQQVVPEFCYPKLAQKLCVDVVWMVRGWRSTTMEYKQLLAQPTMYSVVTSTSSHISDVGGGEHSWLVKPCG